MTRPARQAVRASTIRERTSGGPNTATGPTHRIAKARMEAKPLKDCEKLSAAAPADGMRIDRGRPPWFPRVATYGTSCTRRPNKFRFAPDCKRPDQGGAVTNVGNRPGGRRRHRNFSHPQFTGRGKLKGGGGRNQGCPARRKAVGGTTLSLIQENISPARARKPPLSDNRKTPTALPGGHVQRCNIPPHPDRTGYHAEILFPSLISSSPS